MADRIGQRLGNYTLVKLLGQGGFAEVYLGDHQYLKSQAAIKILLTKLSGDDDSDSFLREAQTIARLAHPNIIRVMDFGIDNETPYLVMDYAPNGTLRSRHPRGSVVPLPTILPYVRQISEALQYAHDEHIIHRDIKPENMLIGRRNEILLSDFGIALAAQSSRYQGVQDVIGTVAYMAPEQIQGKPRPASDQYSLAIVAYEWLTGTRPFQGTFTEMCTQHMFASPPPLAEKLTSVSPAVEQVIMRALDKDPHKRYEKIIDFAQALELAAGDATQQNGAANTSYATQMMAENVPPRPGMGTGNSTAFVPPIPGGTQLVQPPTNTMGTPGGTQATGMIGSNPNLQTGQSTGMIGSNPNLQTGQAARNANPTLHSSSTEMQSSLDPRIAQQQQNQPNQSNQFGTPKVVLPYNPNAQKQLDQRPPYGQQPGPGNRPPMGPQARYPQQQQGYGQQQQPPYYPPQGQSGQPRPPYGQQQSPYQAQQGAQAYGQQHSGTGHPPHTTPSYAAREREREAEREQDYHNTSAPSTRRAEQPLRSAEPYSTSTSEDWLGLGFLGAWKWRALATIIGLIAYCSLYEFHIDIRNKPYAILLVVPLFFGGAFGPIVGAIVGIGGALIAGMLYQSLEPYRILFTSSGYYGYGLSWWHSWAFYGLAGVAAGLAMLGRRRIPSIGSAIRSAILALIILSGFIGYVLYTTHARFLPLLISGILATVLVNIGVALALLIVYSIVARLIDFGA